MTVPCPDCGAAMQPHGTATEHEHGTVRGAREDPTAWACDEGHGPYAITAAHARTQVLAALDVAERTRIRGVLRCAACRTPFELPGRRTLRSVTITSDELPAARVTFDLPLLRCTEDAVESLPPECVADLEVVLDALLATP